MANRTIDGFRIRSEQMTSLAGLDGTSQFFAFAHFDEDEPPAVIEDFLHVSRDIDHIFGGADIVQAMNVPIEHFIIPERVPFFLIVVDIPNLGHMSNRTFPT